MQTRIYILLLMAAIPISAKCDTIDFWHVYYNNVKKIECNEFDYCTFSFLKDSVKANDSIAIYYFMDTRCDDCMNTLSLKDSSGHELYSITAEEGHSYNGLKIPLKVLVESNLHDFNIYFKRYEKCKENKIVKVSLE
jgi:hypothetical protein